MTVAAKVTATLHVTAPAPVFAGSGLGRPTGPRVYVIAAESRTLHVADESRRLHVPDESRALVVPPESRTVLVSPEVRALVMAGGLA